MSTDQRPVTQRFVILLRGVMPTGKNKVPMAPLRTALAAAGLEDVRTYIQSGNVLARSALDRSTLEHVVHTVIEQHFGGDIAVVARTTEQFRALLERNPFMQVDTSRLYFSVLGSQPDPARLADFLATDYSPDEVQIINDTIYTLYATKYSASKFNNNFFERKLKVVVTTRNFNTVTKLVELCAA